MIVNAIMNTGNDADIIELSIRHNLSKLNEILIIDNNSTDGTREIISKLIEEFGDDKLKVINTHSKTPQEHIVITNFFKEKIKLSNSAPDFLFVLDADEFISAENFSELNSIPENQVGLVKWKCYIPNKLDHKNFPKEMIYRRDHEPSKSACHKLVIASHCNGFLTLGNHYLHQGQDQEAKPIPSYELQSISLAHYPVRSLEQMNKKIDFISNFLKYEKPTQSYHLRNKKHIETLDELITKALLYATVDKEKFELVYDPL